MHSNCQLYTCLCSQIRTPPPHHSAISPFHHFSTRHHTTPSSHNPATTQPRHHRSRHHTSPSPYHFFTLPPHHPTPHTPHYPCHLATASTPLALYSSSPLFHENIPRLTRKFVIQRVLIVTHSYCLLAHSLTLARNYTREFIRKNNMEPDHPFELRKYAPCVIY